MAEVLIKAVDAVHSDPDKDRRGCYKKGYPVNVCPDNHPWGNEERLPRFVVLKIPDATVSEVKHFIQEWQRQVDWSVVSQNLPQDRFRLNIFTTNPAATDQGVGAGKLTRAMVENYITSWNGSVVSIADNSVVFDVGIYEASISQGFWDVNLTGVVFSEISYVQSTGIHTVQANYSANINWKAVEVSRRILEKDITGTGVSIISNSGGIVRFTITRAVVSDIFKRDIKQKLERTFYRRQYYFLPSLIDSVISIGGVQTSNKATVLSVLHNRLTE